ncbi:LysR family transcriptional regulator [Rhodococcus wratislaviensis IFP 2016]|nr:LysR family transcriptional regulator [Rhodococcus wratislaviensis IFP 2016]
MGHVASMDVRQMEYFPAVVDNGGINRAAEALHVAQPSFRVFGCQAR